MATKSNGIDWGAIGQSALQAGISGGIDSLFDIGESLVGNYFNKTSAQKAYKRQLQLMEAQYQYAQKYAENSPSWAVKGLRDAGLNPILAAGGGVHATPAPSSPSSPASHSTSVGGSRARYDPLLSAEIKSRRLDNEIKSDTLTTLKAENEVRRLKAEAEAGILRPVSVGGFEGDDKSVGILLPSKSFKALQKGIADDYDLRSERYIRETADKVMKYGIEILDLLPSASRKAVLEQMGPIFKNSERASTYLRNRP